MNKDYKDNIIIVLLIIIILLIGIIGYVLIFDKKDESINDKEDSNSQVENVTIEEQNAIEAKIKSFAKMDFATFDDINSIDDEEKIWRIIVEKEYIFGTNNTQISGDKIRNDLKEYFGSNDKTNFVNLNSNITDYSNGVIYRYDSNSNAYIKQVDYYQNSYASNNAVYVKVLSVTKNGNEYVAEVHKLTVPGCTEICAANDADFYDGKTKLGKVNIATDEALANVYETVKSSLSVHKYTLVKEDNNFYIKSYK